MTSIVTPADLVEVTETAVDLRLRLAAYGDPRAVASLYDEHHAVIRAFARRLLGDPSAAEDLVQDVFLAVPSAAARFRGESSVRSLLLSIAVNLARKHVRTAARRRGLLARWFGGGEERDPCPPPDERIARRELGDALQRAMDDLSVEHRVAFVLCVVEERSSAEAAELVGVPEATVRTRVHYARKRLQDLLRRRGVA